MGEARRLCPRHGLCSKLAMRPHFAPICHKLGTNGPAVRHHKLIFGEDEATGFPRLELLSVYFRYSLGQEELKPRFGGNSCMLWQKTSFVLANLGTWVQKGRGYFSY